MRHWIHKPLTQYSNDNQGTITTFEHDYVCNKCNRVTKPLKNEIISSFSASIVYDFLGEDVFARFCEAYLDQKKNRRSKFKHHRSQMNYEKIFNAITKK